MGGTIVAVVANQEAAVSRHRPGARIGGPIRETNKSTLRSVHTLD